MKEIMKKETEKKVYAAAVYLRLSKEDGDVCERATASPTRSGSSMIT